MLENEFHPQRLAHVTPLIFIFLVNVDVESHLQSRPLSPRSFFPLPSSPPPSILSFLFPPLCLVSTFEVHNFPAAAEQRRLRNSHPLLGAHTRTAWWLPISVNTSLRSNTLRRAGGKSGDEASNWRLEAAGLRLKKMALRLVFQLLSKAIKSLCSSKLIIRNGTQQDSLASKDPTVWLSYQSHAEGMQQTGDVSLFFTQAAINQSVKI